jgi:hypothetical protein
MTQAQMFRTTLQVTELLNIFGTGQASRHETKRHTVISKFKSFPARVGENTTEIVLSAECSVH